MEKHKLDWAGSG